MRTLVGTTLSIIAVGVVLIAYGLLSPRSAATSGTEFVTGPGSRAMYAADRIAVDDYDRAQRATAYGAATNCYPAVPTLNYTVPAAAPVPVAYRPSSPASDGWTPRRTSSNVRVSRDNGWQKAAMIIGGTTAAGAGVGAIVGGGKGAAIGAAIGGGASALWEATHRQRR